MELTEDRDGEDFLLCGVLVVLLVASVLLLYNEAEPVAVVSPWVWYFTSPESLCHVVDGCSDCSLSQGDNFFVRKGGFSHGLCKG